jgi:hypothetical protein
MRGRGARRQRGLWQRLRGDPLRFLESAARAPPIAARYRLRKALTETSSGTDWSRESRRQL